MEAALEHYRQALDLYRAVGDRLGEANVLKAMGDVLQFRKDMEAALEHYRQALGLYRAVGAKVGEAITLRRKGHSELSCNQIDAAEQSYCASLDLCRQIGDRQGEAYTLRALGDIALCRDVFGQAQEHYLQAKRLFQQIGDHLGEANSLTSLLRLKIVQQKPDRIQADLEAIRLLRQATQDLGSQGEDYLGIAAAFAFVRQWEQAENYLAQARPIFEQLPDKHPLAWIAAFEQGLKSAKQAVACLEDGQKSTAKDLAQKVLDEFQKVGDFLLYKLVNQLLAACEE